MQIVPSLLSADLACLGECLDAAVGAGVEWVSVDVMDGHFVPNISFGPDLVRMIKKRTRLYVDAHLMVSNPDEAAPFFSRAGADMVVVHWEACRDPRRTLRSLRGDGAAAGMALRPRTPVGRLLPLLAELDLALVMTVEPGFAGAKFLAPQLDKVRALREAIAARGYRCRLQVDGGINLATAAAAAAAGADSLVAGTAVFGAADIGEAFQALMKTARISYEKQTRGTSLMKRRSAPSMLASPRGRLATRR
ncbi:MAG: ribulose-phosphate 3-epimerase [Elusimicrobia bacterium]|nr:ribulose-phosphate 3-epimerase [Elusimicrobiota bacterium]